MQEGSSQGEVGNQGWRAWEGDKGTAHVCLPLQAFLPMLKTAAKRSNRKGLNCSRAAIINVSTIGSSIGRPPSMATFPVISYRCSKVTWAAQPLLPTCILANLCKWGRVSNREWGRGQLPLTSLWPPGRGEFIVHNPALTAALVAHS